MLDTDIDRKEDSSQEPSRDIDRDKEREKEKDKNSKSKGATKSTSTIRATRGCLYQHAFFQKPKISPTFPANFSRWDPALPGRLAPSRMLYWSPASKRRFVLGL